jgi:prepilin-type N-terminal cleavage/methylation domain-containing protein
LRLFRLALRLHCADGVHSRSHGFTLIEVIIATGLLVTVALGSAQLFALAIDHTLSSRHQLLMRVAAERKIDELAVAAARGVVVLAPPGTLDLDVDGFVDRPADGGAVYVRRWRVTPVHGYDTEALAIVVRVLPPTRTADMVMTAIVSRTPW